MKRPPIVFRIRIIDKGKKAIGLWLPSLVVFLLIFPFVVLTVALLLIADLFTVFRYRMSLLFMGVIFVLTQMTGTSVRINNPKEESLVLVDIK